MENNIKDQLLYANIIKKYHIEDTGNVYRKQVDEQLVHDYVTLYEQNQEKERTINRLEDRLYMLEERAEAEKGDTFKEKDDE